MRGQLSPYLLASRPFVPTFPITRSYIYVCMRPLRQEFESSTLARGSKMSRKPNNQLLFSLFFFIFFVLSPSNLFTKMAMAQNNTNPVNVGVVLDMNKWVGKMGLSCITMALSDFYASHGHYRTRLLLNTRDSKNDVVGAAAVGSLSLST
ncbi:hypothetical protein ACSBR1_039058 [Camellia fascicularis]